MRSTIIVWFAFIFFYSCSSPKETSPTETRLPVIIDTDANNELDDQHAMAYLFFNADFFDIKGVTTNATFNGGAIENHHKEAERVMKLCKVYGAVPLKKGADKNFETISPTLNEADFDGAEAVNFIIEQAQLVKDEKLVFGLF